MSGTNISAAPKIPSLITTFNFAIFTGINFQGSFPKTATEN